MDTNRLITQIALSLYSSTRRTERLPKIVTYEPSQIVEIVSVPESLRHTRAFKFLARSEGAWL